MNNSKTSDKSVPLPSTREILRDCVAMVNNLVIDHASTDESNLCTRNHLLINLARVQANLERGEKREPQLGTLGLARDAHAMLLQLRLNSDSTNVRCRREVLDKLSEIQMKAEIAESRIWIEIGRDGDQWCALLGENLQEGVAGFGALPMEALRHLVIGQAFLCNREISQQATRLMKDERPVDSEGFGAAYDSLLTEKLVRAGLLTEKDRVEMELTRQKFDLAKVYATDYTVTRRICHEVVRPLVEKFIRQHVATDSDDSYQMLADHFYTELMCALARVPTAPESIVERMREENARLVTELKTEKEFSQKLAVEVNQKNETIGALHKERDDAIAQRQTAWDELRRVRPGARPASFTKPVLIPHANSGSVASPTPPEFPKICIPSDNFFHSAACEYLKLRGETVVNNAQVAHEVVRLRDQFLRDHVLSVTYQHETL